jgi:anaerobic sulfite reductase subunit B
VPVEPPLPFRIVERRQETHDAWTLRLEATGATPARFAPGQFAMLYAFGSGEVPISVSAIPTGGDALVHTVRVVGAVTRALCGADAIGLRGPFGRGWPLAEAEGRDVVIVAGGLGLAPLRPVVHALLADPGRYGRVTVMCGGRSPAELLYRPELEAWRRGGLDVEVIVDAPDAGWRGHVGVVTRLIRRARFDPANTTAMACGPEVMMRFAAAALREQGVATEDVWLSLERSMKCATGHCGHCQLGPVFVCKDGPVFRYDRVEPLMEVPEL